MADLQQRFDVVVVGAGPGGYVAALRAAERGLAVAIVEKDRLGGVCANEGCIPTKALLRSAEVYALARSAETFGISIEGLRFDITAVAERARQTAARMEKNVEALLRAAGIPVLRGTAELAGKGGVLVSSQGEERAVEASHIVLATGARAKVAPGFEPDGALVGTCREALAPRAMPERVLVMGAGAIGVEFASFYRAFGAQVTLVEMLPRILAGEDEDISEAMRRAMQKKGIRIVTSSRVTSLSKADADVTATVTGEAGDTSMTADFLLVATGVEGNACNLGLDKTRVQVESGHVVVDEWLRTHEEGVYAIGDLAGPPWLAHKASREAVICIDRIAGAADVRPLAAGASPSCIYSTPQVASVGLSEENAKKGGRLVRCGRATFVGNGKARALGETEGFVKTVFDAETGELLGAHLIGPEVTELIGTFALARTLEATEAEILAAVFPHPTLSEGVQESVRDAFPIAAPRASEARTRKA